MEVVSPVRERTGGKGQLSQQERQERHDKLTHWYYPEGNGIRLEKEARELCLTAKHNFRCADVEIRSKELREVVRRLFNSERVTIHAPIVASSISDAGRSQYLCQIVLPGPKQR